MKKAFRKSLKRQASLGLYIRNSINSRGEHDQSTSNSAGSSAPLLWQALAKKYRFNYPRDWYRIEAHWLDQIESFQEQPIDCPGRDGKMNNAITRISQCNESYQLCNSLPRSFIVPKDLKDVTLMDTMSTVIKDHRVPIISYCCPIEYRRNFIIRCASSDQQERVIETLSRAVKPLKVFNLTSIAPSFAKTLSAHRKLRDACRPKDDKQTTNFMSRTGKWLSIASQALKIANETAKALLTEASVILIEDDDSGWNSLISSLIQVLLEPHRRTVEGFESLISKEWIYLAGGHSDYTQPDILFTLFLDCTYQIYLQNTNEFEFTSEYLRYLFDAQYICATITGNDNLNHHQHQDHYQLEHNQDRITQSNNISNNNNETPKLSGHHMGLVTNDNPTTNGIATKSKTTSTFAYEESDDIIESELATYKQSSISMVDLNLSLKNSLNIDCSFGDTSVFLESGYEISMLNPFYKPEKDTPILKVHDHIANMKLWSSLYLRWLKPNSRYGCLEETIYFQFYPPQQISEQYNSQTS